MWTDLNQGRSTTGQEGWASTSHLEVRGAQWAFFIHAPSHITPGSKRTRRSLFSSLGPSLPLLSCGILGVYRHLTPLQSSLLE